MLESFLPLFVMTFFITLFIVLMQFLWRYIDDLVGKGLGVDVIAELFFYAALTMIPMALPLAILLASLMTFGNLGERFELTAMKASGVSLVRSMRPLIALIVLIAIGAFFFQNNVLPIAQTKMWTLLFSMRQKNPEVEIPEGVFYDQIPGYNLFVQSKNRDTGMLYNLMIYDVSRGFENSAIILADSGKLAFSEDRTHLFLHLWKGEQFENLKEAAANMKNVPYRRESFLEKELLVSFDDNFERLDEQGMRNQYVGKNLRELQATIDSVGKQVDSIGAEYAAELRSRPMVGVPINEISYSNNSKPTMKLVPDVKPAKGQKLPDIDSLFAAKGASQQRLYVQAALNNARSSRQMYEYKSMAMEEDLKTIRRHGIELQKKFTLSFACVIFFFIGAPLGAIIRKGGLGTPLVISVLLFIFYYIIDNTGYKMARDGHWPVWQGMWLSAAVLLPLGIFFTYKAVNDSAVFNPDAYRNFIRRITGRAVYRMVTMKEIVMEETSAETALQMLGELKANAERFIFNNKVRRFVPQTYDREAFDTIAKEVEVTVNYLSNSQNQQVINKLMDFPILRQPLLTPLHMGRGSAVKEMALVVKVTKDLINLLSSDSVTAKTAETNVNNNSSLEESHQDI